MRSVGGVTSWADHPFRRHLRGLGFLAVAAVVITIVSGEIRAGLSILAAAIVVGAVVTGWYLFHTSEVTEGARERMWARRRARVGLTPPDPEERREEILDDVLSDLDANADRNRPAD